ncbi:MAG: hypothetical protein U1C33_02970, partial [Candidatus Cloacimonadaceae bacterium]|nr:hypothetical protein [Candidatus Cloacimonadaceae bacterium]
MKKLLFIFLILMAGKLMCIQIIHDKALITQYSYEFFSNIPRENLTTEVEKKGQTVKNEWKGFRFDKWLLDNGYKEFRHIRFESDDRYMVTLTRYEFEQNECWLVFEQNGTWLDEDNFRLVFPGLRQNFWITGLNRVVLENFEPLQMPKTFALYSRELAKLKLKTDPKPFVDLKAYSFDDLMKNLGMSQANIVIYSTDGLKLRLEYPKHLSGAVLEPGQDQILNLKSPQIPGGMWLNDICF